MYFAQRYTLFNIMQAILVNISLYVVFFLFCYPMWRGCVRSIVRANGLIRDFACVSPCLRMSCKVWQHEFRDPTWFVRCRFMMLQLQVHEYSIAGS